MKKYEFTGETLTNGCYCILKQIRALRDIPRHGVKAGDIGGWIEYSDNLSQEGDAWVSDNACVYQDARIQDNALVSRNACVFGNAKILGAAEISDYSMVFDRARIYDRAKIRDFAIICGSSRIHGDALISANSMIQGRAHICDNANIISKSDFVVLTGFGTRFGTTTFFKCMNGEIRVTCGCFTGSLDEFRKQVEKTRSGQIASEYMCLASLVETHFLYTSQLGMFSPLEKEYMRKEVINND